MRKIKFRAFIDGEYMVFSDMSKTHPYDDDEIIWSIQGGLQISTLELINEIVGGEVDQREAFQIRGGKGDEVHFMQFTGLTDKNGVGIYEGDIISRNGDSIEVKWHEEYCYYKLSKRHGRLTRFKAELSEVIGNIHRDPELLCAKK